MSYYGRRMTPGQPRRKAPVGLAGFALLLLWIGPAFGIATGIMLGTARGQLAAWAGAVPWGGAWVLSVVAGLLACGALSISAARLNGIPWKELRTPLVGGGFLLFTCALASPLLIAMTGAADTAPGAADLASAKFDAISQALLPSLSVAGALLGAAAIGFGPIYLVVEGRRDRRD